MINYEVQKFITIPQLLFTKNAQMICVMSLMTWVSSGHEVYYYSKYQKIERM